jgi:choloylglycine hydrolase
MKWKHYFVLLAVASCVISSFARACTAFQLQSQDGAFIYCRSMEFGFIMDSDLLIVPRGMEFIGTTPQGAQGLKWRIKYGYVGLNLSASPTSISDGMNEKGLIAGSLYLPGFAEYETPDPAKNDRTLGFWELPSFLLGTCATVEEVKNALLNILVAQEPVPGMWDFVLPLHLYIGDQSGKAIVIEYVNGKRRVYDNPIGVLTNSPPFDWQLINLNNYINLTPVNVTKLNLGNMTLQNLGQGTGLLGIPGDYTPSSRFIRASFFSQCAASKKSAEETVKMGFHILNTFDIFEGIVRQKCSYRARKNAMPAARTITDSGVTYDEEMTEWVVVHDRTNLKTYFRNYDSLRIQMVDLKKIDFTKPGFRKIPMMRAFTVDDVTANEQPLPQPS